MSTYLDQQPSVIYCMSSKLRPCFTARPSQIYRAIGIIQCRDDLVCSQFCFTGLGLYIHMDEWAFSTRNDMVSSLLFHRVKTIHTMDEWQSRPKFCKIRRMPWFFSCVWELWMKYCDCNLIFQIMTPNMASVSYDKTTTESLKLEEIQNGQHINRKQNKTLKILPWNMISQMPWNMISKMQKVYLVAVCHKSSSFQTFITTWNPTFYKHYSDQF